MSSHGHDIIAKMAQKNKIKFSGTIIEIGSERGQGSTKILAEMANKNSCHFITIDVMEEIYKKALVLIKGINKNFNAACMKGEEFLKIYPRKDICVLYLDAFDIEYPKKKYSEHRKKLYSSHGLDLSNENAWNMHLQCAENVYDKVLVGGYIVFDDTWVNKKTKEVEGKGKLAVPFLQSKNYSVVPMDVALKSNVFVMKRNAL